MVSCPIIVNFTKKIFSRNLDLLRIVFFYSPYEKILGSFLYCAFAMLGHHQLLFRKHQIICVCMLISLSLAYKFCVPWLVETPVG